jgi:hypothetical protein
MGNLAIRAIANGSDGASSKSAARTASHGRPGGVKRRLWARFEPRDDFSAYLVLDLIKLSGVCHRHGISEIVARLTPPDIAVILRCAT